jgi:hypothetical protein
MGLKFSNFGKAVVGSAPSGTTGLSFTVAAGTGLLFPSLGAGDYFYGIFKDASGNREVVKISARSTDAMTIATGGRGLDGTTARTWAAGDYFVAGIVNVALLESLGNTNLQAIGALISAADQLPYFTGSGTAALTGLSAYIRSLLDDADAATARATLGLGSVATQSAGSVAITGGSVAGITDLAIADGGTGASTAAAAFAALKQAADTSNTGVVELATNAEAQTGTDAVRAVTPANLGATVLGMGQTWQNVTGSRAVSTTYTNSTGRPILLCIGGTVSVAGGALNVAIGGVNVAYSPAAYVNNGFISANGILVPNGSSYAVAPGTGVFTINSWFELR